MLYIYRCVWMDANLFILDLALRDDRQHEGFHIQYLLKVVTIILIISGGNDYCVNISLYIRIIICND